jgi:hypothetical protein
MRDETATQDEDRTMSKTMADQAREQADQVDAGEAVNVKADSYGCGYSEWDLLKDELIKRGYAQSDVSVTKGQWFWTVRKA